MDKKEVLKVIRDAKERNLTSLDLSSKKLTSLPPEIGQLTNLTVFYLYSNNLTSLPPEIGRSTNLTELYLYGNNLTTLPPEIGQLANLTELYLWGNNLTTLPPEIGQLTNLTVLSLSKNNLTTLPPEIGQLTNLTKLVLWGNNLTTLPPEIGQLTNLTRLDLDENNLTTLPPEIGQLTNLTELYFGDNPLGSPPPEIVKQGVPAIRAYLNLLKKEGEKKVYEAKLLIVGQGGVGKTCLCNRLIHNTYNDNEPTTHGIAIRNWELEAPPDKARPAIKMNVWDFGGQEIYHATHQFFLTRRSVYLLVWDARQEAEYGRLDFWLHTIETLGRDSPIILVLNKCDERTSDINRSDYQHRFPQIKGFYRVSCAKPERGPETFERLTNEISKTAWELPLMGNKWFESWLSVRKELEADQRNQMDYQEYLKICSEHNIPSENANILSEYLHDLGVVLHFKDDALLKHVMILKPEWGTRAVYKVLDAPTPKGRGGILLRGDLDNIWKEEDDYPHERHETLLRLMCNFELAFQMEDTDNYIVAELLPIQQPDDLNWGSEENLQFQYHYDFMPVGIMPRFIVRIHEDLEKKDGKYLCWKEGALLSRDGSRASVKAIPGERKIEIRITGSTKRELLAIIRKEFDHINNRFRKVKITKKIPCQCGQSLFDYDRLRNMEKKRKNTDFCDSCNEDVSIEKLLDGVETKEKRREAAVGDTYNIGEVHGGMWKDVKAKEINQQELILQADSSTFEKYVRELSALEDALRDKAASSPNNKEYEEAINAVINAKKAAEAEDGEGIMKWLKRAGKFGYKVATEIPAITAAKGIIEIFKTVV